MSASTEPRAVSSHRKLRPQVRMPGAQVLSGLSAGEARMLQRRLSEPVEYILDPRFQTLEAANELMVPLDTFEQRIRGGRTLGNDDSGVDLILGSDVLESLSAEQSLFLRYNYCRYRVLRLLREHRGRKLTAEAVHELLKWEGEVVRTRSEIVRINLPLVLAMAKRTRITSVDHAELISEGNLALLRSADKFDCMRGYKFSTYACRAILKSFSRVATRTSRYRGYFPIEFDPTLEKSDQADRKRAGVENDCVDELKSILNGNSAALNEVEQTVIRARFALDAEPAPGEPPKAKTLEQVGEMIGVTKERVRQIQNKALEKLRYALEEGILSV